MHKVGTRFLTPVGALLLALLVAAPASAAVNPSRDANVVAGAAVTAGAAPQITSASFSAIPGSGNPAATADSDAVLFPLEGDDYTVLSTGDTTGLDAPDSADDTSTANGGGGDGHGDAVNDLVQLQINLDVAESTNCLTMDFRFLTEEFPEFIGSDFNDAFLAELDSTDFQVSDTGEVDAPSNFAFDPDGRVVTVNAVGTKADNALGTTYDGGTPILRATTPITPGPHVLYLSIYDASDAIYDSTVLIDNLKLRSAKEANCVRGSAPNPEADDTCLNKSPTVFASDGVATGTDGDDVIQGSNAADLIRGKGGDDIICGGPGGDTIIGGAGDDRIVGNTGNDEIKGNKGNDRIDGKKGKDVLKGQDGGDLLKGGSDDDRLFGGLGDDVLFGGTGDDLLRGRGGDDTLRGGPDDDTLRGGKGKDFCRGDKGNDGKAGC